MIVLYAVSVCVDPSHFLTGRNQINLLRNISLNGIIGLGMTFIILTGGIDLSVGSTVSVVAVSVAALLKNGVNPFLAVLAGIFDWCGNRSDQWSRRDKGEDPSVYHDAWHDDCTGGCCADYFRRQAGFLDGVWD